MQQTIKRRPICRFTCLRLKLVTRTNEAFMFFACSCVTCYSCSPLELWVLLQMLDEDCSETPGVNSSV